MLRGDISNSAGEFQEREYSNWFTYLITQNEWALSHGLTHEVDVANGVRFAIVKKSVCHVATNEGDSGAPVLEVWQLKKYSVYTH